MVIGIASHQTKNEI